MGLTSAAGPSIDPYGAPLAIVAENGQKYLVSEQHQESKGRGTSNRLADFFKSTEKKTNNW